MTPIDFALILLGGPLAAGFLIGWAVQRLRGRNAPRVSLAIALLLASPSLAALLAPVIRLGIWDGASMGLLAGVGMFAGLFSWQDYPVEVLLGVASLALTLGAAEWLVRRTFPHPPGFPAIETAKLFLPRIDLEDPEPARGDFTETHRQAVDGCAMLYPERHPAYVEERTQRDGSAQGSVVYLGDSMTYGLGVGLDRAYPAILEQRTPTLFHYNLAFPGTSTDYQYVIAKHWIPLIQPPIRLVVIGLYFNDMLEIGQGMSCCQNRSVVRFDDGIPAQRCPEPSWIAGYGESFSWFLIHSPPPYPLRAAMDHSYVARYAGAVLSERAARSVSPDRPPDEDAVWRQMDQLLGALRDDLASRDIPLVAVMLPIRSALEAPGYRTHDSYLKGKRLQKRAMSLGIRTFDAWSHFRPLVERNGSAHYFLDHDDIHLNALGHAEMANWLLANVAEITLPPANGNPSPVDD